MAKEDVIEAEGIVKKSLPNTMIKVELKNGHEILAHLSGKMRSHYIIIVPGDTNLTPNKLVQGFTLLSLTQEIEYTQAYKSNSILLYIQCDPL
jgi:translation initiation factor IF-1